MPPTHLSNLPSEVTELIASYLDPHDLTQCVRVNSSWHSLLIPSLWRTLRNTDKDLRPLFLTRAFWRAFYRNHDQIRILETNDPNFAIIITNSLTKLQSLTYCPTPDDGVDLSTVMQFLDLISPTQISLEQQEEVKNYDNSIILVTLIHNNQNLRSLSINESCFRLNNGEDAFHTILPRILMLSSLERLEISFAGHPSSPELPPLGDETFMACLPGLFTDFVNDHPPLEEGGYYIYSESLKEVSISGGFADIDPQRLLFLDKCRQLETIRLSHLQGWSMMSIPLALQEFCPNVTHLDWRKGSKRESDESLAVLFSSSTAGWKCLELPDMQEFGPKAFEAFMRSTAETVEVLSVEGWGRIGHEEFLEMLCTASKLRRLEGASDRRWRRNMKVFEVDAYKAFVKHMIEGVDQSWALGKSMEFLQMRICGVPRPDVVHRRPRIKQQLMKREGIEEEGEEGTHSADDAAAEQQQQPAARRYDVQRWIYTQLSRMTVLRELVLGTVDVNLRDAFRWLMGPKIGRAEVNIQEKVRGMKECYNYSSLEFSMESGLEVLAGLKELRVLDVRMTAHRIGVVELEWMRRNWPKLKEVRGLEEKRMWTGGEDDEDGDKVMEEVEAWMAAHPHGIGSSYI
ncbi:MAG: hypothetical protein JOS17DRAFT_89882 [Linnemannia elongata]|nr:MAG: hypothetical protein JOS17DRAFT_89882 [Linnemannia elongata]